MITSIALAAVLAAGPALGLGSADADADPTRVPTKVVTWFEENGEHLARVFAKEIAGSVDEAEVPQGVEHITVGPPAAYLSLRVRPYDLTNDELQGSTELRSQDLETIEYCSIGVIDGATIAVYVCARVEDDGEILHTSASTYDSLSMSTSFPGDGFVVLYGLGDYAIDVEAQTFTALTTAAQRNLGADSIDAAQMITALSRDYAEQAAMQRLNGPAGGGGSPFVRTPAQQAEREALVAEALALPDELAWHEGADMAELEVLRQAATTDGSATHEDETLEQASAPAAATAPTQPAAQSADSRTTGETAVLAGIIAAVVLAAGTMWLVIARRRHENAND